MKQDYIANCIFRILCCDNNAVKAAKLASDLAVVIRIAAARGEQAAHAELIQLVRVAETGEFRDQE